MGVYKGHISTSQVGPAWGSGVAYVINEVVVFNSNLYICLIAHTSTSFAADLASSKWKPATNASPGDISESSAVLANNQAVAADVTGLLFNNALVRTFKATLSVEVSATVPQYTQITLIGIQKASSWDYAYTFEGDAPQITLSVTSLGQVQYTSVNFAGFTSGKIKFSATTLSIP